MKCGTCKGKKTLHVGNGVTVRCPGCKGAGKVTATIAEREAAKRKQELAAMMEAKSPKTLSVVLFGEPVPKGRPRFSGRRGPNGKSFVRVWTPEETEAYEEQGRIAAEAAARRVGRFVTTASRFTIIVRVFRLHYDAGGDGDNYEKSAIDFLIPKRGCPGTGVIPDDRYVRGGAWAINQDAKHPRLEVEVRRFAKGVA